MKAARGPSAAPSRRTATEAIIVALCGTILYASAAWIERALSADPLASALVEEALKCALLLAAGFLGEAAGSAAAAGISSPERSARASRLGAARGLSLGLVAVSIFAAIENLAYLAAFPESSVLARLAWSLPLHLATATIQALSFLPLFRLRAARGLAARGLAARGLAARGLAARGLAARGLAARGLAARGLAAASERAPMRVRARAPAQALAQGIAGIAAAALAHGTANLYAATSPDGSGLVLASAACVAAFLALASLFGRRAYIGGYLHGAR